MFISRLLISYNSDVVKLTAQFVARNGRQFLTTLMNKEQRNYQFDFLRPQHSLFNYFTKLVEQYTKVLRLESLVNVAVIALHSWNECLVVRYWLSCWWRGERATINVISRVRLGQITPTTIHTGAFRWSWRVTWVQLFWNHYCRSVLSYFWTHDPLLL